MPSPAHEAAPAGRAAIDELARAAYKLSAADARLRGRATREPTALSLTHARALKSLAESGPMTIGALAERVETTGAAVTQLVNGLVRAGLVTRERASTGDRRVATVTLTDAGRNRHVERQRHLERSLADATKGAKCRPGRDRGSPRGGGAETVVDVRLFRDQLDA